MARPSSPRCRTASSSGPGCGSEVGSKAAGFGASRSVLASTDYPRLTSMLSTLSYPLRCCYCSRVLCTLLADCSSSSLEEVRTLSLHICSSESSLMSWDTFSESIFLKDLSKNFNGPRLVI